MSIECGCLEKLFVNPILNSYDNKNTAIVKQEHYGIGAMNNQGSLVKLYAKVLIPRSVLHQLIKHVKIKGINVLKEYSKRPMRLAKQKMVKIAYSKLGD